MKTFKNYLVVIGFVLGGFYNAHAQTMMNLEDIEYYLEYQHTHDTILCNQLLFGSYDGDRGYWMAEVNRTALPSFTEYTPYAPENPEEGSPLYGILLFVYDNNNDHCYVYDYGKMFPYSSANCGTLEYDGTGVNQILSDPILDLGEDEEIPDDYIYGAYFYVGDIFELTMLGYYRVRLVIYE